jgi:NADPH-dependent 2,4-dienoyl-CoA reductase/sulfur reductase-like enzyme
MKNQIMRCSVNPAIGFEEAYLHPAAQKVTGKRVFIVGGGPAGMHAALTAQEQGHQVTLCDAAPQLGGLMSHADEMDFKEDMRLYRDSQVRKAGEADIDLRLNCKVDADYIRQEDAAKKIDALIVAVGSEPVRLPVPGADGKNVLLGTELKHDAKVADSVVVIGGGLIGCEAAVDLGRKGAQVTLIEMLGDVALECGRMYRFNLMQQIKDAHINVQTGMRCTRITEEGVYAADANNNEQFFPGKTVIMAAGMKAKKALADSLLNIVPDTYIVGDARRARTIMAAVRDAEDAVVNIVMY